MSYDKEIKFELIPGVLRIDPGRCFLSITVQGSHERLRCLVLPVPLMRAAASEGLDDRKAMQTIIAFKSKAWGAFSLLDRTDTEQKTSYIAELIKSALEAPRGFLECVEPAGWSKIEVVHPGHYAYPGKGFHLSMIRDDLYIESVMEVIWPQESGVVDEQHFVLNPHASSLGAWIAKIFRRHDQSLSTRYQDSWDKFESVVCNDGLSDSD